MSAISSVGNLTPTLNQLIQAEEHNPARHTTPSPAQVSQSASNDSDHDGDSDGGGINKTA